MSFTFWHWMTLIGTLLFNIFILINHYNKRNVLPRELLEILNSSNMLWVIYSLLYFGQYFDQMRQLCYCALMMTRDLLKLAALMLFFFVSFYFSLGFILNRHELNLCDPDFDDPFVAFYTIFKITLNMHKSDIISGSYTGYAITHIVVVAVNAFLILNLLIAVYSDSTSYINRNLEVIDGVMNLSFALEQETVWKWMIDKFFQVRKLKYLCEHEGKLYVHIKKFSVKIQNPI